MNIYGSLSDAIKLAIEESLANVHTTTIAKVVSVNAKTINVKPVFNRVIKKTGFLGVFKTPQEIELPVFENVPIINFLGGSSSIQMPIAIGDYCVLMFTERCFDGWWKGRDNTTPPQYRMHDYSDGLALVGLHNEQGGLNIPTAIQIEGDTVHNGNQQENGNINRTGNETITGDVTIGGISFLNHTHPGDSGGTTGAPQ